MTDFEEELTEHRPDLLRHSYRMLGSFADAEDVVQDVLINALKARDTFSGTVPLAHWLMRMTTNACLNELGRRKRRALPQLETEAATSFDGLKELEASHWVGPAPDSRLCLPAQTLETRETVALAFVALLQRLPPQQRAALLLKDVVGFSTEEIAATLETTVSSVSSALHRARETIAIPQAKPRHDPSPEILREYVRTWEERDIDALVRLLKDDVVFAMPPHDLWLRGAMVGAFFASERLARFWALTSRLVVTHANGELALAFFVKDGAGWKAHSLQVVTFDGDRVASAIQFIGPAYFRGFEELSSSLP